MAVELQQVTSLRFVRGSRSPDGQCFIRQVAEMQPAGHWVLADGSLECGPSAPPGPIDRFVARRLGRRWVSYGEKS